MSYLLTIWLITFRPFSGDYLPVQGYQWYWLFMTQGRQAEEAWKNSRELPA